MSDQHSRKSRAPSPSGGKGAKGEKGGKDPVRRDPPRRRGQPLAQETYRFEDGEERGAAFDPKRDVPLFLATGNPGKVRELQALLSETRYRVIGPEVIHKFAPAKEDGDTYEANAIKKAYHYSCVIRSLVLADDSGLSVDALGGEPGIRSARAGGVAATDADRVRLILSRMENVPWEKRTARFHCSIAVALQGKPLATFSGSVEGMISFEPAGSAGFGYDPIFYYPQMDMTFAEMTAEEKDHISHRGQALERARAWLEEYAILNQE